MTPVAQLLDAARPAAPAAAFLARHGQAGAQLELLEADASTRRYFRVVGQGLLLMEDRRDPESLARYVLIARHLRALGLSAPVVQGVDIAAGLALVEDFGADTYSVCLARGMDEETLYELALDALLHLHLAPEATQVHCAMFDVEAMLAELRVFTDWFAPLLASGPAVSAFGMEFQSLWKEALSRGASGVHTLVLRDFHKDNLMLLAGRRGVARCGLLDFQDAVIGPAEYDLVSLLQDARRDVSPALAERVLSRYCDAVPARFGTPEEIRHRFGLYGAQRHLRIAGLFVRLSQRDGKPGYIQFLPRVLRQVQAALGLARLTGVAACLDAHLGGWSDPRTVHAALHPPMTGPKR